jgi:hypothetical protein
VFVYVFGCANVARVTDTRADDGGLVSGQVGLADDGFDVFVEGGYVETDEFVACCVDDVDLSIGGDVIVVVAIVDGVRRGGGRGEW